MINSPHILNKKRPKNHHRQPTKGQENAPVIHFTPSKCAQINNQQNCNAIHFQGQKEKYREMDLSSVSRFNSSYVICSILVFEPLFFRFFLRPICHQLADMLQHPFAAEAAIEHFSGNFLIQLFRRTQRLDDFL